MRTTGFAVPREGGIRIHPRRFSRRKSPDLRRRVRVPETNVSYRDQEGLSFM
jgi:hypothetical protein